MSSTVVLGFDMETDIGSWTPFYEGLLHGTPAVLEVLARHGVKATFFFTGDAAKLHPQVVRAVDQAGHEVGCHSVCHETLGDELFPIPGLKPVLPEECYHRIEVATDMVQQVLGRPVHSFRAPRLWGSTAMVNALEDLGYEADASYPLFFYQKQLAPYHPSRDNWLDEGDLRIVEIPNFADLTIQSTDPHGRDRDQWPLFRTHSAGALMERVERMLALYEARKTPAVICLYLHPWEFHEMPQGPIHFGEGAVIPNPFIVKNCGPVAVRELDRLIGLLLGRDARFQTAQAVAREHSRPVEGARA